jgi:hypothetical protein
MKKIIFTLALSLTIMGITAQVVSNLKPSADGKMGEFSEWTKADVILEDKTTASIEYRIALVAKKGIGCHYALEVKNTSDVKINVRMKSNYYDKLVKSYFGDEIKESLKPGKSVEGKFVGQGCKKEKGVEKEDYEQCLDCDLTMSIFVTN